MAVRGRLRVEEEAADVSSSEIASGNARFLPLISRGGSWIDNPEDCGGNVTRRALVKTMRMGDAARKGEATNAYFFDGLATGSSVSLPFPLLVLIARGRLD